MNPLTIAYFTSRKDPKLEWFFISLRREFKKDYKDLKIIVIDFYANEDGRKFWLKKVASQNLFEEVEIVHSVPMPCVWQGEHKKTKEEWFAAANARNTAFALCETDYIACVDDLSFLEKGWIDQVRHAQHHKYVVLGAYKKVKSMKVSHEGEIIFEPFAPGIDSRWGLGSTTGIVPCTGSWMYGCSFGVPMHYVLKVDGFDGICNSVGMEDCEFGCRLYRAGAKMFYNLNMLTYESEEDHFTSGNVCFKRNDRKSWTGENADWYILNRCVKGSHHRSMGNEFSLEEIRKRLKNGEGFPIPQTQTDWATKKLLSEL